MIALQLHSQRDSTKIASIDLDSLYSKALRGITAIEDLADKKAALKLCDSAKVIQGLMINNDKMIITNQKSIIEGLRAEIYNLGISLSLSKEATANAVKIGKKGKVKAFFTGVFSTGIGAALIWLALLL